MLTPCLGFVRVRAESVLERRRIGAHPANKTPNDLVLRSRIRQLLLAHLDNAVIVPLIVRCGFGNEQDVESGVSGIVPRAMVSASRTWRYRRQSRPLGHQSWVGTGNKCVPTRGSLKVNMVHDLCTDKVALSSLMAAHAPCFGSSRSAPGDAPRALRSSSSPCTISAEF